MISKLSFWRLLGNIIWCLATIISFKRKPLPNVSLKGCPSLVLFPKKSLGNWTPATQKVRMKTIIPLYMRRAMKITTAMIHRLKNLIIVIKWMEVFGRNSTMKILCFRSTWMEYSCWMFKKGTRLYTILIMKRYSMLWAKERSSRSVSFTVSRL